MYKLTTYGESLKAGKQQVFFLGRKMKLDSQQDLAILYNEGRSAIVSKEEKAAKKELAAKKN